MGPGHAPDFCGLLRSSGVSVCCWTGRATEAVRAMLLRVNSTKNVTERGVVASARWKLYHKARLRTKTSK